MPTIATDFTKWMRLLITLGALAGLLSGCGYNEFQSRDEATKAAVFARTRAALEEFLTGDLNVTPVSVTQRTHGGTKHRFPVQRAA